MISPEDIQELIIADTASSSSSDERQPFFFEHRAIQEFIDTENTYNNSLSLLAQALDGYQQNPVLIQIQASIVAFLDMSTKILNNIQRTAVTDDSLELKKLSSDRIGFINLFVMCSDGYVELYKQYLAQHTADPMQFSEIDAFIKAQSGGLNLNAHLILPAQRGPRYLMLIDAALKNEELLNDDTKEELQKLRLMFLAGLEKLNKMDKKEERKASLITTLFSKSSSAEPVDISAPLTAEQIAASKTSAKKSYQFGDVSAAASARIYNYFWKKPSKEQASPDMSNEEQNKPS